VTYYSLTLLSAQQRPRTILQTYGNYDAFISIMWRIRATPRRALLAVEGTSCADHSALSLNNLWIWDKQIQA